MALASSSSTMAPLASSFRHPVGRRGRPAPAGGCGVLGPCHLGRWVSVRLGSSGRSLGSAGGGEGPGGVGVDRRGRLGLNGTDLGLDDRASTRLGLNGKTRRADHWVRIFGRRHPAIGFGFPRGSPRIDHRTRDDWLRFFPPGRRAGGVRRESPEIKLRQAVAEDRGCRDPAGGRSTRPRKRHRTPSAARDGVAEGVRLDRLSSLRFRVARGEDGPTETGPEERCGRAFGVSG